MITENETGTEDLVQDELGTLKLQCETMGIKFHPSSGVDSLKAKIAEHMAKPTAPVAAAAAAVAAPVLTEGQIKRAANMACKLEATVLVRCRVVCMNPNKRDWFGEIISAGNSVVATQKKLIPFGVEYHVPRIILNQLEQRKCQVFFSVKDGKGGSKREGKLIKEFAIEILPDLTEQELKSLAQRQAMANGTAAM